MRKVLRARILNGERPTLTATVEPDGDLWFIFVREARAFTEAPSRDGIEAMARDVTAVTLDVPEDSFDVRIEEVSSRGE